MPIDCPCGSGEAFAACCAALHRGRGSGRVTAPTAERLMRSRYSAFAVADAAYLLATWHPATRPAAADLVLDPDVEWRRLEITGTTDGGPDDDAGTVEFVARYWDATFRRRGEQRETSAFVREDGQWFYVGPAAEPGPPIRT
ncbi:YchJ family protein [Paraconexibacter antarcticus]|uniref:YchJ family protein n=1 Tax=Paraconexibacter antarcticus TaxID=2949664 RepID=UPI003F58195E